MKMEVRKALNSGKTDMFTPMANLLSGEWRTSFNNAFKKFSAEFPPLDLDFQPEAASAIAAERRLSAAREGQPLPDAKLDPTVKVTSRPEFLAAFKNIRRAGQERVPGLGLSYAQQIPGESGLVSQQSIPDPDNFINTEANLERGYVASSVAGHVGNIADLVLSRSSNPWARGLGGVLNYALPLSAQIGATSLSDRKANIDTRHLGPEMTAVGLGAEAEAQNVARGEIADPNAKLRAFYLSNPDQLSGYRQSKGLTEGGSNALVNSEMAASTAFRPLTSLVGPGVMSGLSGAFSVAQPFIERYNARSANKDIEAENKVREERGQTRKPILPVPEIPSAWNLATDTAFNVAKPIAATVGGARLIPSIASKAGLVGGLARGGTGFLATNAVSAVHQILRGFRDPGLVDDIRRTEVLEEGNQSPTRALGRAALSTILGDPLRGAVQLYAAAPTVNKIVDGAIQGGLQANPLIPGLREAGINVPHPPAVAIDPAEASEVRESAEREAQQQQRIKILSNEDPNRPNDPVIRMPVDLSKLHGFMGKALEAAPSLGTNQLSQLMAQQLQTEPALRRVMARKPVQLDEDVVNAATNEIAKDLISTYQVETLTPVAQKEISNLVRLLGPDAAADMLLLTQSSNEGDAQDQRNKLKFSAIMGSAWVPNEAYRDSGKIYKSLFPQKPISMDESRANNEAMQRTIQSLFNPR